MSPPIRDVAITPDEAPEFIKSTQIYIYLNVVLSTVVVYDSRTFSFFSCLSLASRRASLYAGQGGTSVCLQRRHCTDAMLTDQILLGRWLSSFHLQKTLSLGFRKGSRLGLTQIVFFLVCRYVKFISSIPSLTPNRIDTWEHLRLLSS